MTRKKLYWAAAVLAAAAGCRDGNPTSPEARITGQPAGPSFHMSNGGPQAHWAMQPTITAPSEAAVVASPASLTVTWTAPAAPDFPLTKYQFELQCSGTGCQSIPQADIPLGTTTKALSNLPAGTYTAYVRGFGVETETKNNGTIQTTDHASPWATVTFYVEEPVGPSDQEITFSFGTLTKTYGEAAFDISSFASANSSLPVSFSSVTTSVCTVAANNYVTIVGAGTCTIEASQAGNAEYNPAPNVQSSFTVNKAPLTITANDKSKTYDGAVYSPFDVRFGTDANNDQVLENTFVNGDDEDDLVGTLTFGGTAANAVNANAYNDVVLQGKSAYVIAPSGYTSNNYDITFVNGTLLINQASLTIKADNKSPTYNGQTNAGATLTASYTGFVNNETETTADVLSGSLTFATLDANEVVVVAVNAGTYIIRPSGQTADNYRITFQDGTLTINKATPTIVWNTPADIVYGTTLSATQLNATAQGVGGATLAGAFVYTPPAGTKLLVGSNQALKADFTPNDTQNYNNASATVYINVLAWTLTGFYQPVDMRTALQPNVWNTVKGGSTVPLKFNVYQANQSTTNERTDTDAVTGFQAQPVVCNNGSSDAIEFVTTGSTSLRYDATAQQFIQNWQTPRKPGMCYRVIMTTADGSTLEAYFQLK